VGAVVYVLDAQEDLRVSTIQDMHSIFRKARHFNPETALEVFINKVDGDVFSTEDTRMEIYQTFQRQIVRECEHGGLALEDITYHLTSVYSPSIFEAWSLVVQKIFPHQATISALLDALIEAANVEKAFLFDTSTRLHVATDHNPVDQQTLMLCAEALDVVTDLEQIYAPAPKAFDEDRGSVITIKLNHDMLLFARQVGFRLAIVCVMRCDSYSKPAVFEHNVGLFKQSLDRVLGVRD
jgi:Ras-related GTP-binding protein C/D